MTWQIRTCCSLLWVLTRACVRVHVRVRQAAKFGVSKFASFIDHATYMRKRVGRVEEITWPRARMCVRVSDVTGDISSANAENLR